MPRVPLPPFPGGPPSQPYAIPSRGAVHGPVGAVPHVPPPGSRGFGAGRGSSGAPIGSHLSQQQGSQQTIGSLGPNFNFPSLENPSSQPSVGGPLSQPGYVNNVRKLSAKTKLFKCYTCSIFFGDCSFANCLLVMSFRCLFKGQANLIVMDFQWEACLRYQSFADIYLAVQNLLSFFLKHTQL